jgi:uncharacterized protein YprB with RNaseH-like and TPR domain
MVEAKRAKNDWLVIKPLGKNAEPQVWLGEGDDESITKSIRDGLHEYDYIVTYNGTRFDMPFLATRLMVNKQPEIGIVRHIDLYYTVKHKLRLHRSSLQAALETIFGNTTKSPIIGGIWRKAHQGDTTALNYIVEHCIQDCFELERLFLSLKDKVDISYTPARRY